MKLKVEYSPLEVAVAKKPKIDRVSKNLEFSVDDTVETFLSTLLSVFHIQDEHIRIDLQRDGGMPKSKI